MTKTAVITGASRGIGKAISHYLAEQGYNLVLLANNTDNLKKLSSQLSLDFPNLSIQNFSVDLSHPETVDTSIQAILAELETIDILVSSAGVLTAGHIDVSTSQLIKLVNVNLTSTMLICNAVAQRMRQQKYGEIYNLGSTAGLSPVSKIGAYSATKSAIVSYSQSLYQELLPHNIKVCCLCPSVVDTDMTNDGRIDNSLKIETTDITKAMDFIRQLSSGASMSVLPIRCKVIDMES
ncbi:SDR family NAD(P)-dependent oxidoreductase [Vibrio sp.]|uniref:SDR family NAD(P)-dependent oxidoreductase n=1 Tax=Vibrio sp. TaxID=678 RepID=UPI00311D9483